MSLTDILIGVILFFFVAVSALMCLIILMQRSKQEGLGTAFAGQFTGQILGAQASSFLVKATVVLAGLFFALSIALAQLYSHKASISGASNLSAIQKDLLQPVPPPSTNAAPVMAPTPTVPTPDVPKTPTPATPVVPAPAAPAKPGAKPQ